MGQEVLEGRWVSRTLLAQGLITEKQVRKGIDCQSDSGGHLGQILIDMGFVSAEQVRQAVAKHLRLDPVDLTELDVRDEVAGMIPGWLAAQHRLVPVDFADGTLTVATDDPHSLHALGELRARLGCRVKPVIGDRPAVSAALDRLYGPEGHRPPISRPPVLPSFKPLEELRPEPLPADPLIGRTVASCRLLRLIGKGGAGSVYQAEQAGLGKPVAVKVIHEHLLADLDSVERFEHEARAAGRLEHPDIVRTLAVGQVDGRHFIVMEYVDGRSLAERLEAEGPMPCAEALAVAARVADVLAVAHECGMLHLDVKPGNVMTTQQGDVKVADFGVARDILPRMGAEGRAPGTPVYMAPEQFSGARPDHRADLYSLGATLYEMLSGRLPLAGYSLKAISRQHAAAGPTPLSAAAPKVPAAVAGAVMRLLSRDPADRFQSAREVAALLRSLAEEVRTSSSG